MHDDGNGHEFHTQEGADLSRILIHYFRNAEAGGEPSEIAGALKALTRSCTLWRRALRLWKRTETRRRKHLPSTAPPWRPATNQQAKAGLVSLPPPRERNNARY